MLAAMSSMDEQSQSQRMRWVTTLCSYDNMCVVITDLQEQKEEDENNKLYSYAYITILIYFSMTYCRVETAGLVRGQNIRIMTRLITHLNPYSHFLKFQTIHLPFLARSCSITK